MIVFSASDTGQPYLVGGRQLWPVFPEPARVLVADPPWKFRDTLPGRKRGAAKHYPVMTTEQICAFPLPPLARDCLLVLWRVAPLQQEALDVVRAWGFAQKSELVWIKITKNGKRHMGMGRTVRGEHETALLATRGKFKVDCNAVRSTFTAKIGVHSEKPELFYQIVERLAQGPYTELFARRQRPGWTCLGNQA